MDWVKGVEIHILENEPWHTEVHGLMNSPWMVAWMIICKVHGQGTLTKEQA